MEHPIWLAVVAVLGIPAVTSGATTVLDWLAHSTAIPSRVWVYLASLVITAGIIAGAGVPTGIEDPALAVGAWLAWATANAELARRLYEALWERLSD